MPNLLLVMIGGAAGAALRYRLGLAATERFGPTFPWGTLIANLAGALLIGMVAAAAVDLGARAEPARLLLGVGLLGGVTTFSACSIETVAMIERGDVALALGYAAASVVGGLLLAFAGLLAMRSAA
jgi:fluoride exporter